MWTIISSFFFLLPSLSPLVLFIFTHFCLHSFTLYSFSFLDPSLTFPIKNKKKKMTTIGIWKSFEAQIVTLEQEREAVRQVFQHLMSTPHPTTSSPHSSTDPSSDRQGRFNDFSESHNPHKTSIASISLANTPLFICQLVLNCQGDQSLLQRRLLDLEMSLLSKIQVCRETQLQYTPNSEQQVQLAQFEKHERIRLAEIDKDKQVELVKIASEERIVMAKVSKDERCKVAQLEKEGDIRRAEIFANVRKIIKDERWDIGNFEKEKEIELARVTKEERIELAKNEKDVEQIAKEKEIRLAEIIAEARKIIKDERWDVGNFDKEKRIELAKIHKDITKIQKDERCDIGNFAKEERVRLAEVDHGVKKLEKEKATRLAEIDRHDCQCLA